MHYGRRKPKAPALRAAIAQHTFMALEKKNESYKILLPPGIKTIPGAAFF
jgi:hypothetical protein